MKINNCTVTIHINTIKKLIICTIILEIICLSCLYASLGCVLSVYVFKTYERTDANIESQELHINANDDEFKFSVSVSYTYSVNDQTYSGQNNAWWRPLTILSFSDDNTIPICYSKTDPGRSKLWHVSYLVFVVFILLEGFTILIFILSYRKIKKSKECNMVTF